MLENLFTIMLHKYDFITIVMYQEMRSRRDFVHDCWVIAKLQESEELMLAITHDPYFFITRDDILDLLKSENH